MVTDPNVWSIRIAVCMQIGLWCFLYVGPPKENICKVTMVDITALVILTIFET